MARTLIASDNFNRAGPALGANWTQLNATDAGDVAIVSSTVIAGEVSGLDAAAVWAGAGTFTADQYASIVLVEGRSGITSYGVGVIARASTDTNAARDYYYARVDDNAVLGKIVNGTNTTLHSAAASMFAAGDRLELECEGTTIRVMKNGVALGGSFTVTDSSLSTGKPGVLGRGDPGIAHGDDWEGGNITAGGGQAVRTMHHFRQQGIS